MEKEMQRLQQTICEGEGRLKTKEEVWSVAMVMVMFLIIAMLVVQGTHTLFNKHKIKPNNHRKDGFYSFKLFLATTIFDLNALLLCFCNDQAYHRWQVLVMASIFKKIVFFYKMAPYLRPLLVQHSPCHHCSGLYTLSDLLRHVKSVHPLASLVSQANQVILFFASVFPSCVSPWFYSFCLLGLVSSPIQLLFGVV